MQLVTPIFPVLHCLEIKLALRNKDLYIIIWFWLSTTQFLCFHSQIHHRNWEVPKALKLNRMWWFQSDSNLGYQRAVEYDIDSFGTKYTLWTNKNFVSVREYSIHFGEIIYSEFYYWSFWNEKEKPGLFFFLKEIILKGLIILLDFVLLGVPLTWRDLNCFSPHSKTTP